MAEVPQPLDAFLAQAMRELPTDWPQPPGQAERLVARWLEEQLERTEDELFGRRFARSCPVPGRAPADYLHRLLLPEGSGPMLLAGIRFKGGSLDQPFVELLAWDRPIGGPLAWERMLERIFSEFAHFDPRWIRLRWPGSSAPPLPRERLEADLRLVAGRLEVLRQQPRPWGEVAVDVRPVEDLSFYEAYRAAFSRWQAEVGPRGLEVHPETEADLRHCLATGAVVCAFAGQRWAGLCAAGRMRERALDGYSVYELFLDKELRGRRRAAILQRQLVDALIDRGRDVLFGTIHRTNMPSLRTAQRTGRRIVETWWFVSP